MSDDLFGSDLQDALDNLGWDGVDPPPRTTWKWIEHATRCIHILESEVLELRKRLAELEKPEGSL